jgi:ActR/RegA family two-component response regulator
MKSKLLETQIRRRQLVAAFNEERTAHCSISLVPTGAQTAAEPTHLPAGKARRALLLVSDDAGLGVRLGNVTDPVGLVVMQINDSASAFRLADRDRPAVVLLDLDLPADTGWDAAERFLADESGPSLVLLTGRTDHFSLGAAIQAGVIMDKSASPAWLLGSVDRILMETDPARVDRRTRQQRLVRWLRPYDWTDLVASGNRHWGINE